MLLGELSCLAAAVAWAVAVAWFRPAIVAYGAPTVNLVKSVVAAVLLGLTVLATGEGRSLFEVSGSSLALTAVSGLLGLSFGDTFLFAAVHRIGVHRTLLFQTLAPIFAALLAFLLYGERLGVQQVIGGAVVLAGLTVVVAPGSRPRRRMRAPVAVAPATTAAGPGAPRSAAPAMTLAGAGLAALAAFGQGSGVVLAKMGMAELPMVAASFVRMAAAAIGMAVLMAALRRLERSRVALTSLAALRSMVPPTFLGTYLAFLLMMTGIALAPASIAAVLLATTPIFSLFVDARLTGTPITGRGFAGTLLAVLGVGILVFS